MKKLTAVSMIVNGKKLVFFAMLPTESRGSDDIKTTIPPRDYERMMATVNARRGDTVSIG